MVVVVVGVAGRGNQVVVVVVGIAGCGSGRRLLVWHVVVVVFY